MGRVSTSVEVLATTPQAALDRRSARCWSRCSTTASIFALMCVGTLVAAVYLASALRGRLGTPVVVAAPVGVTPPSP